MSISLHGSNSPSASVCRSTQTPASSRRHPPCQKVTPCKKPPSIVVGAAIPSHSPRGPTSCTAARASRCPVFHSFCTAGSDSVPTVVYHAHELFPRRSPPSSSPAISSPSAVPRCSAAPYGPAAALPRRWEVAADAIQTPPAGYPNASTTQPTFDATLSPAEHHAGRDVQRHLVLLLTSSTHVTVVT